MSTILESKNVKSTHFQDYPYPVKSLGAWGGDFVLTSGDESSKMYFKEKGFRTIINFEDMCLTTSSNSN